MPTKQIKYWFTESHMLRKNNIGCFSNLLSSLDRTCFSLNPGSISFLITVHSTSSMKYGIRFSDHIQLFCQFFSAFGSLQELYTYVFHHEWGQSLFLCKLFYIVHSIVYTVTWMAWVFIFREFGKVNLLYKLDRSQYS